MNLKPTYYLLGAIAIVSASIAACSLDSSVSPQKAPIRRTTPFAPAVLQRSAADHRAASRRLLRDLADDAQKNRRAWFGDDSYRTNPARVCAGLVALLAKHSPSDVVLGLPQSAGERLAAARRFVGGTRQCASPQAMSLFSTAPSIMAAATRASELVTQDRPPTEEEMDAMAAAAVPNEDAAQGYLSGSDADAAVDGAVYELQGYDGEGAGPMSLFYLAKVDWQDVKSAALAGCVAEVRQYWGVIRTVFRSGLAAGPQTAIANAVLMAGGICAFGAASGALVAWAAFK